MGRGRAFRVWGFAILLLAMAEIASAGVPPTPVITPLVVQEFPLPPPIEDPIVLTAGPDGDMWFTDFDSSSNANPENMARGDCNRNDRVTVDELVVSVAIGLERLPLSACLALVNDGEGPPTIADLVTAVDSAIIGCTRP